MQSQQVPQHSHPKISLPSFSKQFPSFKLPNQWLRSLYGGSKPHASLIAKGKSGTIAFSSLPDLEVGLDWQGVVRYGSKAGWSATVSPYDLDLGSAELIQGANLISLRGTYATNIITMQILTFHIR